MSKIRIKLALLAISAGILAAGIGTCLGDILGDAWVLRAVD